MSDPVDPFVRSITFSIAATKTSPGMTITVKETSDGKLEFTIDVLSTSKLTGDLRGLFFDFNRDSLLPDLKYSGTNITAFDTIAVTNLGNGVTMQDAGAPYDVGISFGTANLGKDDVKHQVFTLYDPNQALTLDDIANVEFGVRLTSVGSPTGSRSGSAKLVTVASAAPDARDDTFNIFEDGRDGLGSPATTSSPLTFTVLVNDTDADHNTLLINAVDTPSHGTLSIIDGPDADLLIGDALRYTPTADYAGTDQFRYAISDGHGGTDFAWVHVNIAAVADVPDITCQIMQGDSINQIIVRVTAGDTDTDGSEFIDRLEFSGLPNGAQVSAFDTNPADHPHTLTRDFVLNLPDAQDWHFDFTVTGIAKESSNGDEESASVTVPIDYVYGSTDQQLSFSANDRSIWGTNASDSFAGSDIQSDTASFNASYTALDGIIGFTGNGSATAGILYQLALDNGTVDAHLDYDLNVESRYNQTTDQLVISSAADLVGGDFATAAMDGRMDINAMFAWQLYAAFTYNLDKYLPGVQGVETLANLSGGLNVPIFSADSSSPLLPLDSTDIFGNHMAAYWPAAGSSADVMAGDGSLSSTVDGSSFADLSLDLDLFLTLFYGFPNMVVPIKFDPILNAQVDLLDLGLDLNLDFNQDFKLQPLGLDATITFENGQTFDFVFGQDFSVAHASAIDAAGTNPLLANNGAVDFTIAMTPDASFSNQTTMDMDMAFPFDVLKLSGSWDLGPASKGTFNIAAFHDDLTVDVQPGTLFDDSFALDFVGQSLALVA